MEMEIRGTLHLTDEEVTITVSGEQREYQTGPAKAYNDAKETIIAAEEKRREKITAKIMEIKEDKS